MSAVNPHAPGTLGLYLHIPFCKSKCLYCDFCSYPSTDAETVYAYVDALCRDLEEQSKRCVGRIVDTVYFGGGTPTLLPAALLERILETVYRCYRVSADAEISAECNPATESLSLFRKMRRAGFNRLSIGLQSTHENELRALGRVHSYSDFLNTVEAAVCAGFENLSADVMLGIPEQTEGSCLQTLERLCSLPLSHISAYGLSVEEGTPFGKMGDALILPDEDSALQMYFGTVELLADRGFLQYEISNFAKPGYESRHNLKYWNCEEYLGFGPAAHSFFAGERYGNARDLAGYLAGKSIVCERQTLTDADRINEYVMLRMRLCEGVRKEDFSARFKEECFEGFQADFFPYLAQGFVEIDQKGIRFTKRGFAVSNAILSQVLCFSS